MLMKKFFTLILTMAIFVSNLFSQSLSDTLDLEEVVVTGSRIEISRKNMPVNVSVINSSQINAIQESAVLPLISRRIPGVFVNERGVTGFGRTGSSSAGNISVRGVGGVPNAQVLVLVDGHPQYMGIFGHPLSNNYVASDLERVEIIRGPASILYGSNAMGGVINFITKEQKKDGFSGSLRAGYGSFNTQKYMANTGFKKGKFRVFASFNHDQTDGHRDSMNFNINNAYLKSSYAFSDHLKIQADFNIADFTSFDPGRVDEVVNTFVADMTRGKASVSFSNKYEKFEGGVFLYYNFGDHDFSDGWKSTDENLGLSIYQGMTLFKGNTTTLGFDKKRFGGIGNIAFPSIFANRWLNIDETAAYIISRQSLTKNFMVSAGLRLEDNSLFGNEWIPQVGANYQLNHKSVLKASVSKGFRSPTISELYLFAPNPDLRAEEMINYELSYAADLIEHKMYAEFTLFLLNGENLIETLPNPTPPPMSIRSNTGKFNHKGFELEMNYWPFGSMNIDLTYSYLNMDKPKLAAPEHQLFIGSDYKLGNFVFSLQSNYIAGLYVATENTEGVATNIKENYLLVNASVKYNYQKWLDIFISGKNLINTDYQIDYGYTMPGINFMTGVNINF
jgi:iron complex outermembrane recepter protein